MRILIVEALERPDRRRNPGAAWRRALGPLGVDPLLTSLELEGASPALLAAEFAERVARAAPDALLLLGDSFPPELGAALLAAGLPAAWVPAVVPPVPPAPARATAALERPDTAPEPALAAALRRRTLSGVHRCGPRPEEEVRGLVERLRAAGPPPTSELDLDLLAATGRLREDYERLAAWAAELDLHCADLERPRDPRRHWRRLQRAARRFLRRRGLG
jgi:hypothetical protein